MMRLVGLLCGTLALASCAGNEQSGASTTAALVSPTLTVGAQISPQSLPMSTAAATIGCPLVTTSFDLIVLPSRAGRVSVQSVTLRLIDGTSLGGPMLTFPRPELNRMFGSLLVVTRRAFTFQAQFGCATRTPRSMAADIVVVDETGAAQTLTASASFQ
jgi:hypothetical protein